uniref:Uncharacterized protein n=1 Tax=Rhizophora mucronata TaxID=61149 RepID=A0A2P2Q3B4_RHIMU
MSFGIVVLESVPKAESLTALSSHLSESN